MDPPGAGGRFESVFTDRLFHPNGTSLALHAHAVTYGVLSLPLQWIFGSDPPGIFVVYNLVLLLSFALTGYFTYRLALLHSGHRAGALLAGLLVAFLNFRFMNTVRLHVIAMEWLVLLIWAWSAFLRSPSPARMLGVLGAGVLLLHASLEYTASALLLMILLAIPAVRGRGREARPRSSRRAWIASASLGGAATVVLIAPFLTQLLERLSEGGVTFDPRLAVIFSADLFDFVLPNPRHPLWGQFVSPITAAFHEGDGGYGLSLGWSALGLFTLTLLPAVRARNGPRWVIGVGFFLLLSLGPVLHLAGSVYESALLPHALVGKVPVLGASRTPMRYVAPAMLCLSVAAAIGWSNRRTRKMDTRVPSRVEILVGGVILLESLAAPLRMTTVKVPEVYRIPREAATSRIGALVQVPGEVDGWALLWQTVHECPLVAGVPDAIPLHSPRPVDPMANRAWHAFTYRLAGPSALSSLPDTQRSAMVGWLRRYLDLVGARWVVVPRAAEVQWRGSRGTLRPEVLGARAYGGYCGNLRELVPVRVEELGAFTIFEFPIRDRSCVESHPDSGTIPK